MFRSVAFDPQLPLAVIGALAAIAVLVLGLALWRGLAGWWLRALAALVLLAALAGPSLRQEDRARVPNIALVVVDDSQDRILINTGNGKGKSSAAFGVVARALGHGMKVTVIQFIKGAWDTGERRLLTENFSDLCEFHAMGEGFTWETQDRQRDIAMAGEAWQIGRAHV